MNYPSGTYIIVALIVFIVFILTIYYYANKLLNNKKLYIISNVLLIALLLNLVALFILMITYNKVKYTPGIQGPKGLRGEIGGRGIDMEVEQCQLQSKSIGSEYINKETKDLIRIQKPVIK